MDWKYEITQRYEHMFVQGGYPTVGDGWQDLLERALARIDSARGPGSVQIGQIKEKFGSIRIYYDGMNLSDGAVARIDEAIELAEMRSYCTCEECGAEGRLYNRGGWYLTRCLQHASGEAVRVKPGWENLLIVTKYIGDKRVTTCRRYDRVRDAFAPAALPPGYKDE